MRHFIRISTLALSLTSAAAALAASGGEHHDAGIPWLTLLFSTVNVLIFAWVLNKFAMPSIRAWVKDRHDRIIRDLNAADEARAEATRIKAEWERRLAELEAGIATMRAQAQQDAERERERILAEAQKTAERIQRDAEQAAAAEIRQVRTQLRAELTRRAMDLAEQSVRERWNDADQDRFVSDFIKQVQA